MSKTVFAERVRLQVATESGSDASKSWGSGFEVRGRARQRPSRVTSGFRLTRELARLAVLAPPDLRAGVVMTATHWGPLSPGATETIRPPGVFAQRWKGRKRATA
jgi:hypothetical protein